DAELVEGKLAAASRSLLEVPGWLAMAWLWQAAASHPATLSALEPLVVGRFRVLPLLSGQPTIFPVARLGIFPLDMEILTSFKGIAVEERQRRYERLLGNIPMGVVSWRVGVLIKAGVLKPIDGITISTGTTEYATSALAYLLRDLNSELRRGEILWAS